MSAPRPRPDAPPSVRRVLAAAAALGAALALAAPARAQAPAAPAAPAAAPNAAAAGAPPASTFNPQPVAGRPSLRGWTSDRREFAVGDILTVFVDDYTISTAVKDDLSAQRRGRDLSVRVQQPSASVGGGLSSRNDADARNRGEARRENRFQSELSVRVVAAGPNGTYQVRGTRLVDVDKAKQQVTLTGWVRAQDVTPANTVESSRLADAQIAYLSPGPLGKPKQGLVTRVISILWP